MVFRKWMIPVILLLLSGFMGCASTTNLAEVEESLEKPLPFQVAVAPVKLAYLRKSKEKDMQDSFLKKPPKNAKAASSNSPKSNSAGTVEKISSPKIKGKKRSPQKVRNGASPVINPESFRKDMIHELRKYKIFKKIEELQLPSLQSTKNHPLTHYSGDEWEGVLEAAKKQRTRLLIQFNIEEYRVENLGYNGWWYFSTFLWFGFFGTQWLPPDENFRSRILISMDIYSVDSKIRVYSATFDAEYLDNLMGSWGITDLLGLSLLWNKEYEPAYFKSLHKSFFPEILRKLHYKVIREFIRKFAPYTKDSKFKSDLTGVGFPPNMETDFKKYQRFDDIAKGVINLSDDRGIKEVKFALYYTPNEEKQFWEPQPVFYKHTNQPGISIILDQNTQDAKFHRYFVEIRFPKKGNYLMQIRCDDEDDHHKSWEFPLVHAEIDRKLHAVIIGVGKFQDKTIQELHYAQKDASDMANFLLKHKKELNVGEVIQLINEKATAYQIRKALGVDLVKKASPYDTILIYYSGHGVAVKDPSSPDQDGLEKYFVPYDTDRNHLYSTAIRMGELQKILKRISSERVLVFIDSCYSGSSAKSISGFAIRSMSSESVEVDATFRNRFKRRGLLVMTASDTNQYSYESSKLDNGRGNGYFTYFLLQGLRGKADLNGDGLVRVTELSRFVRKRVQEQVKKDVGQDQTPSLVDNLKVDFPLVRLK